MDRLGRTLNRFTRKLYKRNSLDSLNTIRERSLERSRDYDLWVYPDEIYPYLQEENIINNENSIFLCADQPTCNYMSNSDDEKADNNDNNNNIITIEDSNLNKEEKIESPSGNNKINDISIDNCNKDNADGRKEE